LKFEDIQQRKQLELPLLADTFSNSAFTMVFADKMKQKHLATFATLLLCHSSVSGFTAPTKRALVINKNRFNVARPLSSFEDSSDSPRESTNNDAESSGIGSVSLAPLIPSALALFTALPADAAGVVPTALWAYAHYVSILVVMASLVGQRVLVKAGMSDEEEDTLQIFDAVFGVSALLLIVSGYYRVTEVRLKQTIKALRNCLAVFLEPSNLNSVSLSSYLYSLGKELTFTCTNPSFGLKWDLSGSGLDCRCFLPVSRCS
jgi:hypothetical protein